MQFVLNSALTIVIIVFLLGLLIFVHELGHYLVAKRLGVAVQEFAFGFGPKLWKRKRKGTEYRINLIPLGGYVKLLGDQDGSSFLRYQAEELKPEEKKFVYALFAKHKLDPHELDYDKVFAFYEQQKKELSNDDLKKFDNFMAFDYIPNHPGNLDKQRPLHRAAILIAGVVMNMLLGAVLFYIYFLFNGFFVDFRKLGDPHFLLADSSNPPILYSIYDVNSKYLEGSVVIKANDQVIYSPEQFSKILQDNYDKPIKFKLFSDKGYQDANLVLNGEGYKSNFDQDLENKVLVLSVEKDSAAELAGLKGGDFIITFAEQQITSNDQLKESILENRGKSIKIDYLDEGGTVRTAYASLPQVDNDQPILGISYINNNDYAAGFLRISYERNKLLSGGVHALNMIYYTIVGTGDLISQSIAQKSLAPVSQGFSSILVIPDVVYSLVKINDFASIINLTGMISVSLAFMNILPIPLFDGGHMLFLVIEKLRGKPLSAKKQEKIGQIAFVILILLTIVIMTKDIFQIDLPTKVINLVKNIFGGS